MYKTGELPELIIWLIVKTYNKSI